MLMSPFMLATNQTVEATTDRIVAILPIEMEYSINGISIPKERGRSPSSYSGINDQAMDTAASGTTKAMLTKRQTAEATPAMTATASLMKWKT